MIRIIYAVSILLLSYVTASAQCPVASFTMNDSIPSGTALTISNNTVSGNEFNWDFATGDLNSPPSGSTLPISFPAYEMKMVKDNGNYYAFVINYGGTQITRLDFGNDPSSTPV